jgi:hypothetical protein
MAPEIPCDVSYALCQPPSFDVAPHDIPLGTILLETDTRPKRPDVREPLNEDQIPPIDDTLVKKAAPTKELFLHSETLRSTTASIWAHVDFLPGVGGRVGGEGSKEKVLLIHAKDVVTKYFNPTREFFIDALKVDPVRHQLGDFRSPVVYMVTGVKVAARASIIIGTKKSAGSEVGPAIDLTQFGIPVNVGTDLVHKFKDYSMIGTEHDEPIVLAYETRRIKVKKEDYEQKIFRKFAVLGDEPTTDLSEALLNSLDIKLVTPRIALEETDEVGGGSS